MTGLLIIDGGGLLLSQEYIKKEKTKAIGAFLDKKERH